MNPISFSEDQVTLHSNAETIDNLQVLPVQYEDGGIALVSAWKEDNVLERLRFLFTGRIYLHVLGRRHPPVAIDTISPIGK